MTNDICPLKSVLNVIVVPTVIHIQRLFWNLLEEAWLLYVVSDIYKSKVRIEEKNVEFPLFTR